MQIELTPAQLGKIEADGLMTWPEQDCFGRPFVEGEKVNYTRRWVVPDKVFAIIPLTKDANDLTFSVKTNAGASLRAMKETSG
jgi:hypothetical protein